MVGPTWKVTYRLGVYSRIHKEQVGKIWTTSFINLTRKEVQDFHEQRRKGEFMIAWDTIENLLQDKAFDDSNV